ncbi:integrase [Nonomuraea aridisoli]|uniref:Integrase n=1 Tax=Nonomuraea aridisoli TaxID=2070368 RepID=A0A2W2ET73_9ACTN|nr:integrase [Nonomuraea aridisoli]
MSPQDGTVSWVVVDASYALHAEACAFLAALRGRDLSPNTERAYAGRVALYLTYCSAHGVDWAAPGFVALQRFRGWLVTVPYASELRSSGRPSRFRSQSTANAILTAMSEFLRVGASHGWVAIETVALLSEPKYLRHLPPGYDAGEFGQFRTVRARTLRFSVAEPGYETLTEEQIRAMLGHARRARDRFLVMLLAGSGMRIGEALGLRREDVHLLSNSSALGCREAGPHVHVRRRRDNANGALAKARRPRSIPVNQDLAGAYADYQHERGEVEQAVDCDMVFVNLFRAPLGRPMTYRNAKDLFDRLARLAGHVARPHMLRHTVATRLIRAGAGRDVVQTLLGHVSPASMQPYLHPTDQDKRQAVEKVARARQEGP